MPLSLKHGGMYHEVKRSGDRYELSFEKSWYEVWKASDNVIPADDPVYCFTAVFAPVALKATIYHHWYYRPDSGQPFTPADRIPLKISGGREEAIAPTPSRRDSIRVIGASMWKRRTDGSSAGWRSRCWTRRPWGRCH